MTADTREWDEWKRQGALLLKVVLTNKSKEKDLKIWYRLGVNKPADEGALNVPLAVSARKIYLNAKG